MLSRLLLGLAAAVALAAVDLPRFLVTHTVHERGVVIITGASSGIGRDAARAMGERGWVVLAGARKDADVAELGALAGVRGVKLDVAKDEDIAAAVALAVDTAAREGIPFAGVVNNAGYSDDWPIEFLGRKTVARVFDVNLFGAMALMAEALPHLRQSHGRIVSVGSIAGQLAAAGMQPYAGTKAAMESVTDSLRREVGHLVAVVQVDPGCVQSKFFDKAFKANDNSHKLPGGAADAYGAMFSKRAENMKRCEHHAEAPGSSTTPAIVDALTSAHPRSRYFPSSWNNIPGYMIAAQAWVLPDLLLDMLLDQPIPPWLP